MNPYNLLRHGTFSFSFFFFGMELFQGGKEALKDYSHNVLQLVNSSVTSTEINRDR